MLVKTAHKGRVEIRGYTYAKRTKTSRVVKKSSEGGGTGGGRGGAIEDINLRSFLIKGTPPGNGGNLLDSLLVLEIKKPITRPMWL